MGSRGENEVQQNQFEELFNSWYKSLWERQSAITEKESKIVCSPHTSVLLFCSSLNNGGLSIIFSRNNTFLRIIK